MASDEEKTEARESIRAAVEAIKRARPAYEGILDFYGELAAAHETAKGELQLAPIQIPEETLSVKMAEGFPLVSTWDFVIDQEASEALLREICVLASGANEVLAHACGKLVHALEEARLDSNVFFSKILGEEPEYFEALGQELHVDEKVLAFFSYSSIRPSLIACAQDLANHLDESQAWEKAYCPICGTLPCLSILRGEGGRWLVCAFCSHEWRTLRMRCPFCDNDDQEAMYYLFSEEEKGYRIDACKKCNRYIKTVDSREVAHPIHPLVEQISTLHLDMLAQEEGLESGVPLWLPM